jgi:hypothetical protein
MSKAPDNVTLATGYCSAASDKAFELFADLLRWPEIFSEWITRVADDDERVTATGGGGERFDLYPHADQPGRALDVERVDELGAADMLRIRLFDVRSGGCFVAISAARPHGVPDAEWDRLREGLAAGAARVDELLV